MISEVVMPQMGADMTEGTILRWLKQPGDDVKRGEVIAEIETDKANVEIEAFESGVFRTELAHEGDVVQVGEVIAVIAEASDDISSYQDGATTAPKQAAATASAPPAAERAPATAVQTSPSPQNGRVRASPLARRIAADRGIDISQVRGSGPDGRITKKDVETAISGGPQQQLDVARPTPSAPVSREENRPPATGSDTVIQPTKMRQAIARRTSQSKRDAPHYYITADIDMTDALEFRRQVNAALGDERKVSINDLIVRASALALQAHPEFNATIEGDDVTQRAQQHVCIGIALDEGLIAPAIVDAGAMTLAEVAAAARDLVDRAKNGRLRAEEMSAGTFTISNLGAYGVETLIAIIQPPQTAILGVGAVAPQAVVRDGAVVARQMLKGALSADHRVTDGAQGAQFLAEIKRMLEQPMLLVL